MLAVIVRESGGRDMPRKCRLLSPLQALVKVESILQADLPMKTPTARNRDDRHGKRHQCRALLAWSAGGGRL